ncbi:hypothetical protein ACFWB2_14725 [Streptomyces virginiae]|uniref:hypothetical protein n=1 Tax=Streptomyces virginiae TaxID=1961 RepID=UPI0036BB5DF3
MGVWDDSAVVWDDLVEPWGIGSSLFQLGTVRTELLLGDAWTDITSFVRYSSGITVNRGRTSEGSSVERSTCSLTLDNRDGRFSPRNPNGAYFGLIGRNTQIRTSVALGKTRLVAPASVGDSASTAHTAALAVVGDIDVRIDVRLHSWREQSSLIYKWGTVGNQSWYLRLNSDGTVTFFWTADGTTSLSCTSTVALPLPTSGRKAIRATLDVDNGAGGHTVTFYTSDVITGSWAQLGDAVAVAGTTAIYNSTLSLNVDASVDGAIFYGAQVLSGISGSVVANPDFTDLDEGTITFSDMAGRTWTAYGNAEVTNRYVRFSGEVSAWPQKWDPTGTNVTVDVEASGIMRRLSQGKAPLKSTLFRGLTTLSALPVGYWPHEDQAGSTVVASGLPGGPPMRLVRSAPDFGKSSDFACSAALPTLNDASWGVSIPTYTNTGNIQTRFLLGVPLDGIGTASDETIVSVSTSASAATISLLVTTAGELRLIINDRDGLAVLDSGALGVFETNGNLLRVSVEVQQSGGNVAWAVRTLNAVTREYLTASGVLLGYTIGRASNILVNPGGGPSDTVFGHLSIQKEITSLFDLTDELTGYVGEPAGRRAERLCAEEAIPFVGIGDLDDTVAMGAQTQEELLTLLQETADADFGIFYEPREVFGLGFRTRESMQLQSASATLSYTGQELSEMEPVDDDQATRNDITAVRKNGSSYRLVAQTGALSVQAPPLGVGRYDDSVTVNVQTDDQLQDQAGWRLYLGTLDEARYPTIGVQLARSVFTDELITPLLGLDLGDRMDVSDPPAWLPPGEITQLVQGSSENFDNLQMAITLNCTPASLWSTLGTYEAPLTRYSSDGSTLNANASAGATSITVRTFSGPLWGHGDGDFNILVDGEEMTVTAVAGSTSPQTFTVVRSVNGITAAHGAGAAVALSTPFVYGI